MNIKFLSSFCNKLNRQKSTRDSFRWKSRPTKRMVKEGRMPVKPKMLSSGELALSLDFENGCA
jgi:hypothetical protein